VVTDLGDLDVSTIIVLERSTRFRGELEVEWSRTSGSGRVGAIESAASVADVFELSNANRNGMLVADLEMGQAEVLRLLERWDRNWPIVVIGPPETAGLEWPLRELGATAVLFEPVNPSRLMATCRRVLKQVAW
tara:strand:- start:1210 stop:1611 length:402 start_codon:yes stop_codon:yes gene_type:complete